MKLLLLITFNIPFCYFGLCQKNITYKAIYSITKSMYIPQINDEDTSNNSSSSINMEGTMEVIANMDYALIITKISNVVFPIKQIENEFKDEFQNNRLDTEFVNFSTNTIYRLKQKLAISCKKDTLRNTKYQKVIEGYQSNLYLEKNTNFTQSPFNIYCTKELPWYINPGLFYQKNIGGVTYLDNDETEIELKSVNQVKFNLSEYLKRIKEIKIVNSNSSRFSMF